MTFQVRGKFRRKRERKKAGRLRDHIIQQRTEKRYAKAIEAFGQWLTRNQVCLPGTLAGVDAVVSDFIETLWDEGDTRNLAADLLSGLQHSVPALRHHLPLGWRLLSAWRKLEVPARATQLALDQLLAMAAWCLAHHHTAMAVGLLLAYHCLLRTGELLDIIFTDFTFAADSSRAVLQLGYTKGGQRRGEKESIILDDGKLVKAIRNLSKAANHRGPLLPMSSAAFRKLFSEALAALLLDASYKPYSLRRGGATHLFQLTFNYSQVAARGRWQAIRTARIYVDDAAAELAACRASAAQASKVRYWKSRLSSLLVGLC